MNRQQILLLLTLKNASSTGNTFVVCFFNNQNYNLVNFLYKEGLIQSFNKRENSLLIYFRKISEGCLLSKLKLIFKPSFSMSLNYKNLSKISSRQRIIAVSTDKGILNINECKKIKIGGKPIFLL
jgi:ribosomal protein S8